jgi:hypothetical protein
MGRIKSILLGMEAEMNRRVRAPARLADDDGARMKEGPLLAG